MKNKNKERSALDYHEKPKPGKIEVVPTKKYRTQRDLSLAYSPGVAFPCIEIEKNKNNAYKYTNKGNLVAVISNGTAVLGLGDIGPEASKPVMEGKGLLFKIFAGIDVFDIEIDKKDPKEFIETVKAISPSFGGINLEDIKSPEAFEIESSLIKDLDIPVMHDDQHGTAIISSAALINAVELVEKKIDQIKIVISGAGAAAISCGRLYKSFGVKSENIIMTDSKGVIRTDRKELTSQKLEFATNKDAHYLEQALIGADVFIGLSKANILNKKMILSMADNPIVFALANPDPEIKYDLACSIRDDIIMATGRSDHPNQVNNVLGFPFIFRGALDVRAKKINEEMKISAVKALAELAKKPVPEQVNIAYNKRRLSFGRNYIIPKPFDPRLIEEIPIAVAKAAIKSGVAQKKIKNWDKYRVELSERIGNSHKIIRLIHDRSKEDPKKIVFVEADQLNILKGAQIVKEEGIGEPILLGNRSIILELMDSIKFDQKVKIIDPRDPSNKNIRDHYTLKFLNEQINKGISKKEIALNMLDRNYFGAMMVKNGDAEAMITGFSISYPEVIKPIIKIIGKAKGVSRIAATNLMITNRGPIFLSDTTLNVNPNSKELVAITKMTSEAVKMFGINPIVAMLSFSNFNSSNFEEVEKVNKAVKFLKRTSPKLIIDGPVQTDFALNNSMLKERFPFSNLVDKNVNTLIFPNLDSANIAYKLMKELNKNLSIGPILLGLAYPVHVLQLDASVDEIVNMAAIAVIDAQKKQIK
ncbi:MAG: NADP-dependent malic enzyme [Flavobacteriaceae bacterium]|nr:NADP-dependent malic enzyme [Flavobacteriaceae bacterium]